MLRPSAPAGSPSPARILVVEDERHVREMLRRWLIAAGYECCTACNSDEADAILAGERFDLLTSDIEMPGRTGAEWLPLVSARFPNLPILMLTGCDDTRLAVAALSHGAWGYLLKPMEREDLLFQIDRALERKRLLQAELRYVEELEWRVHEQTQHLRRSHEETIERLISASMVRDDETGEHIRRIGLLSAIVAQTLGWLAADVDAIRLAAPMHDIGKVGIPDAVLRKPGKLTAEEMATMQTHTSIGAQILSGSQLPMLQMAEKIARSHHERWDGAGYPDQLSREAIPLPARIVAVVDVYDALTHDRVYRPAFSEAQALLTLEQGAGQHFDPKIVAAFFESLPQVRRALREFDATVRRRPAAGALAPSLQPMPRAPTWGNLPVLA